MTDLLTENARLRAGPQIAGYTCKGCVHFRSEYWAEPDGEGGMDSGTSAACAHGEGRHISTYYGTKPPVPDWCPLPKNEARAALATPAPDAPDLMNPTVVHANMLRGTITKPTVAQIIHLYGSAVFLEHLYERGFCKPTVSPAPDAVQEAARADRLADAAKTLLSVDEYGNRKEVYAACEGRVKVYKFDAALTHLSHARAPSQETAHDDA